jgi:hypothetical protein
MKIEAAHAEIEASKARANSAEKGAEAQMSDRPVDDARSSASLSDLIGQEVRPALPQAEGGAHSVDTLTRDIQKWLDQRDFAVTGTPLATVAEARVEAGNLTPEAAKQKYAPLHAEMETKERIVRVVLRNLMERILGKTLSREQAEQAEQAQPAQDVDRPQKEPEEGPQDNSGEVNLSL